KYCPFLVKNLLYLFDVFLYLLLVCIESRTLHVYACKEVTMMPKHLVHFPFLFLLLTAITGVWMRLFPILNHIQIIPYDHILHGHSHVAVLGWTFLAVLVLYLKVTWEHLIHQKQAIVL